MIMNQYGSRKTGFWSFRDRSSSANVRSEQMQLGININKIREININTVLRTAFGL